MDAVGIFAEEIRKIGLNTLHHGVNGINNAIGSGDGMARDFSIFQCSNRRQKESPGDKAGASVFNPQWLR